MATFRTLAPEPPPVPPGIYLVKVIAAKDRVSANGNPMITMRMQLPDGHEIPCTITFVEAARRLINAFCDSAELVKPDGDDVEVELSAAHVLHRWLYVTVGLDSNDDDAPPKIIRFLTRAQAVLKNLALEQTVVNQVPIRAAGQNGERAMSIDFDEVRQRVPLPAFLESLGGELQKEGDTYRLSCPLHGEQHGRSFIIYPDNRWHCHGKCVAHYPYGGDVLDLAGALWNVSDLRAVAERLLGGDVPQGPFTPPRQVLHRTPLAPRWPTRQLDELAEIVQAGPHLYDVWERSPCRFDEGGNHAEEIVDLVFPGDPLLCGGLTERIFFTKRRGDWRGHLHEMALIVPNPMLRPVGLTRGGRQSEHTLDATAGRVHLVIECDFVRHRNDGRPTEFLPLVDAWERDSITTLDACAAVLWHLAETERLPLVLGVYSGNKSVQGWFGALDRDEDTELLPFMRRAVALGADPVTWTRSQFVRLPDGRRQNGCPQATLYFNPLHAVSICTQ